MNLVRCVDANGHVGTHRTRDREDTHGRPEEAGHIGPYGAEEENYNGTLLREAAALHDWTVLNTWDPTASGKTWYGGKQCSTRVDYILTDIMGSHVSDQIIRSPGMHRRLRTLASLEVNDHVPL